MTGFDLSTAGSVIEREEQGQAVHITDAAGNLLYQDAEKTKPVTMTVVGTYSRRYKRAMEGRAQQARKRRLSEEEAQRDVLEATAECVIAWDGFHDAGKPLECKPSNVVKVLEAAPWIYEQVATAMWDHAGFLRAASLN